MDLKQEQVATAVDSVALHQNERPCLPTQLRHTPPPRQRSLLPRQLMMAFATVIFEF
jgi:hypothetical protein